MKRVQILKSGKQIKKFDCVACDLSHQVLKFYGVVNKNGRAGNDLTLQHIGNSYIEIDRIKRECIVIPEAADIQLLITW